MMIDENLKMLIKKERVKVCQDKTNQSEREIRLE